MPYSFAQVRILETRSKWAWFWVAEEIWMNEIPRPYELSTRVTRYKHLLREEAQKNSSSFERYFKDYNDPNLEIEINAAKVIGWVLFVCSALTRPLNKSRVPSSTISSWLLNSTRTKLASNTLLISQSKIRYSITSSKGSSIDCLMVTRSTHKVNIRNVSIASVITPNTT